MGHIRIATVIGCAAVSLGVAPALSAQAASSEPGPASLTAEQRDAMAGVMGGATEASSEDGRASVPTAVTASGSTRASYYRGSPLMWTRDNVDFGYTGSKVSWTSRFQQKGRIYPNQVTNRGITRFYHTTTAHKFRALNRYGAGTVTPWGNVDVYTYDGEHHLTVHHTGAWRAFRIS